MHYFKNDASGFKPFNIICQGVICSYFRQFYDIRRTKTSVTQIQQAATMTASLTHSSKTNRIPKQGNKKKQHTNKQTKQLSIMIHINVE